MYLVLKYELSLSIAQIFARCMRQVSQFSCGARFLLDDLLTIYQLSYTPMNGRQMIAIGSVQNMFCLEENEYWHDNAKICFRTGQADSRIIVRTGQADSRTCNSARTYCESGDSNGRHVLSIAETYQRNV